MADNDKNWWKWALGGFVAGRIFGPKPQAPPAQDHYAPIAFHQDMELRRLRDLQARQQILMEVQQEKLLDSMDEVSDALDQLKQVSAKIKTLPPPPSPIAKPAPKTNVAFVMRGEILKDGTPVACVTGMPGEKRKSRVCIASCKATGDVFPHTLITGPGGLGKTTLARAIAYEMQYVFYECEAASFKTRDDIINMLRLASEESRRVNRYFMIFVDEIHRLSAVNQEVFYYPMKEWRIPGNGVQLNKFCLVGATTRADMLDAASFRNRFQNQWDLQPYDLVYLTIILGQTLTRLGVSFVMPQMEAIGKRCLGNPRQAVTLAHKIRDHVLSRGSKKLEDVDIQWVWQTEGIDSLGLTRLHRQYLEILRDGRSRGLAVMAGRLGQHEDVVSGTVEPVLLWLGLIDLTRSGRVITDRGIKHLGCIEDIR